ncbi:MAG: hypothetical protein JNL74_02780 [Fibrobacteres bacterium]|nr:hypothetical protein [Fibrobacterota bacterium]
MNIKTKLIYAFLILSSSMTAASSVLSLDLRADSAVCATSIRDAAGKRFILKMVSLPDNSEIESAAASVSGRSFICAVGASGIAGGKRVGGVRIYPDTMLPFSGTLKVNLKYKPAAKTSAVQAKAAAPFSTAGIKARIKVMREGIYAVTYDDLASAGLSVAAINPDNISIWTEGKECPISVETAYHGKFQSGDRVLFYGTHEKGRDGTHFAEQTFSKCYYLGIGSIPGLRAPLIYGGPQYLDSNGLIHPFDPSSFSNINRNIVNVSSFRKKVHIEEDNIIVRVSSPDSINSDKTDPLSIESAPSDYWMWVGMCSPSTATGKKDITFKIDAPPASNGSAKLRIGFLGYGYSVHAVQIFLNNTRLALSNGDSTLSWTGQREAVFESELSATTLKALSGGTNTLSILYSRNDCLYLNYLDAEYDAAPMYTGTGSISVNLDTSIIKNRASYLLPVKGFAAVPEIWDLEGRRFTGMQMRLATLELYDVRSSSAEYFMTPSVSAPEKIEIWRDTVLAPASGGAALLMIGPSGMREAAEEHARHRTLQGISSFFAPVDAVYDRFGTGAVDPAAIKAYVAYAISTFNPKPLYLLILGDATELSDKKSRKRTQVPTYFTQVNGWGIASADSRFTTVSGDDPFPDISIGRIPGQTPEAVGAVLAKIRNSEKSPKPGLWRNDFIMLGGLEKNFTESNNYFHTNIAGRAFNVLRADADPASEYNFGAATSSEVSSLFNKGALFAFFYGHGGGSVWSDGRPLPMMDNFAAAQLSNINALPIVLSLTCLTGSFETVTEGLSYDLFPPLGETMLLSPKGGSSAFYGASGHSFSISDYMLGELLLYEAASLSHNRVGDLINSAEQSMIAAYGADYFHVIAQYNLLGDPSMPIAYPESLSAVTILNQNPQSGDTLRIAVRTQSRMNGEAVIRIYGDDGLLSVQYAVPYSGTSDTLLLPLRAGRQYTGALLRVLITDGTRTASGSTMFATSTPSIINPRLHAISSTGDTISKVRFSMTDSVEARFSVRLPSGFSIDTAALYWEESSVKDNNVLPANRIVLKEDTASSLPGLTAFITENRIYLDPSIFSRKKGINYCISIRYRSADNTSRLIRTFYFASVLTPPDLAFLLDNGLRLVNEGRIVARLRFINQGESDASPFSVSINVNSNQTVSIPYLEVLPKRGVDSIDLPFNAEGYFTVKATLDSDNRITETDKANNVTSRSFGIRGSTLGRLDSVIYAPYGGVAVSLRSNADTLLLRLIQDEIDSLHNGFPVFTAATAYPLRPGQHALRVAGADSIARYVFTASADGGSSELKFSYTLPPDYKALYGNAAKIFGFFRFDTAIGYWRFMEGSVDTSSNTVSIYGYPGYRYTPGFRTDMTGPVIRALSAGRNLDFPDFVPVETPIDILFEDNSAVDTGSVKLFLKGFEPIPRNRYSLGLSGGSGNSVASFRPFRRGSDSLYAVAKDVNGNISDTLGVAFTLGSRLALRSFANHPNPFGKSTIFAYTIEDEADVELRIYTLAGYLVKVFKSENIIGYHEIPWDAIDKDGKKIPNGPYYVKFTAKNRSATIERIFKIAKTEGR